MMLAPYGDYPSVIGEFCYETETNDFKEYKRYRLFGSGRMLPVKSPRKLLSVALIGVASDEKPLLETRDRLGKVKGVSGLKMTMVTRSTARSGREVGFSLSFNYIVPE